uniref:Uncharacterized protein n=1 Tax=Timema shepardi TaxID=629360 RepID=A0A7R9B0W7_TIMSH|nr:unnamed protein product [Timema shepardi]
MSTDYYTGCLWITGTNFTRERNKNTAKTLGCVVGRCLSAYCRRAWKKLNSRLWGLDGKRKYRNNYKNGVNYSTARCEDMVMTRKRCKVDLSLPARFYLGSGQTRPQSSDGLHRRFFPQSVRSCCLNTLPAALRGILPINLTPPANFLNGATRGSTNATISASVKLASWRRTTNARGSSPASTSGTPTTATSATPGSCSTTFSSSVGETCNILFQEEFKREPWVTSCRNTNSPARRGVSQTPHPPGVSVLISDLLFHLGISQCLEERGPLVGLRRGSERYVHSGERSLAERVCPLVPAELPPDAVRDRGHKLPAQPQLGTELHGECFRVVFLLAHVPFDLIHQRSVANMDIQLDYDALVTVLFGDTVRRETFDLLTDGLGDSGHKRSVSSKHRGNVLTFLLLTLFLLMGDACGTASSDGTHGMLFLALPSLGTGGSEEWTDTALYFSSLPSMISSTSDARNKEILDAKTC